MKIYFIALVLTVAFCLGCGKRSAKEASFLAETIYAPTTAEAGTAIKLGFKFSAKGTAYLALENSFGPTIIKADTKDDEAWYHISPNYVKTSGNYQWHLFSSGLKLQSGNFDIHPKKTTVQSIEPYLGPRSIRTGGNDFTMLTIIPTDRFDNTLSDSTLVYLDQYYQYTKNRIYLRTKNGIVWHKLFSGEKSGRMLVSAICQGTSSKELTAMIKPSGAVDFSIETQRVHSYADGNQVAEFKTSILTDKFGNVLSDGVLVNFICLDTKGNQLQTKGISLAGIATAKMLHPGEKDNWKVTAYITGEAKSNTLIIDFDPAVADFEIHYSKEENNITIGPITGFMQQLVPDGMLLNLAVFNTKGALLETKEAHTKSGIGTFSAPLDFYKKGTYRIEIMAAGIHRSQLITVDANGTK